MLLPKRHRLLLHLMGALAMALAVSGCKIVTNPTFADLIGSSPTDASAPAETREVMYGEEVGCERGSDVYCSGSQTLDIHRSTRPVDGPRPVFIWVHGGGWSLGDKTDPLPPNVTDQLRRGYDVLAVNYRLAPAHPFPAAIKDVKLAVRWARFHAEQHGWDPSRIVVAGHSAGGNLAVMVAATAGVAALEPETTGALARTSSAVSAAVSVNGLLDLADAAARDPVAEAYVRMYVGCTRCDAAREASAARWIGANAAPVHLVHGALDAMALPTQGLSICLLYAQAGRTCSIDVVDSGPDRYQGHEVWLTLNQAALNRFLDDRSA